MKCAHPIAASALAVACIGDSTGPGSSIPATIDAVSVESNPHNTISALVYVRVRHADSVAVRFRLDDWDTFVDSVTPAVVVLGDSAVIPVLGLLPTQRYTVSAVAFGADAISLGAPLEFTTDTLPSDLPSYSAQGTDPTPGYVVFAADGFGIVIDNSGRVVWYRRFLNGPGLNFMAQPSGRFTARPSTPDPADIEPWLEVDPLGNITRTFGCALGLPSRFHDLIARSDGDYWLLCDETRVQDLSALGGAVAARVTGTTLQHISRDSELLFGWSPFEHFDVADLDPTDRAVANVNWTHGNALDLDDDGNIILSFRTLGEVTKIDGNTGAVIWRLGGRRNQFTFQGTSVPAFARQHSARAYASSGLLLLDNVGDPTESRAERYVLDEVAHTAQLVESHGAGVVTLIGGSVQDLPNGRMLVSFGTAGRVQEFDATGRVVWEITEGAGYVFRAQRIRSLYAPGVGSTR
jgi:hypothetical protein